MNIALLQGSLEVNGNPGFDLSDPRFYEITALTEAGKYLDAAVHSEALIAEGIYDIRLVCYCLYGHWLEHGLGSLVELVDCLNQLLASNWEAITPADKRNISLAKSLDWLFRHILKQVKYQQVKNSAVWQQWLDCTPTDMSRQLSVAGESLRPVIHLRLADAAGPVLDQFTKIEQWLTDFKQLQNSQAELKPTDGQAGTATDLAAHEIETAATAADTVQAGASKAGLPTGEVSYPLQQLLTKLSVFEQLLAEQKLPQAALLADDINQTIAVFDPKLYFPNMFEAFVRLQALHYQGLSAYAGQQGHPHWQAMQAWLKVDIESFINHSFPDLPHADN